MFKFRLGTGYWGEFVIPRAKLKGRAVTGGRGNGGEGDPR